MAPPSIKLTYFDIEGRAECVRLALVLSGTDFDDDRVSFSDWPAMKPTTPYGKLPLMSIDGGSARSQSGAMLRWVGSTCSETLYPTCSLFEIEEAIGLIGDMQDSWAPNLFIGMRPQNFGYPEGYTKTEEGQDLVKKLRTTWVDNELPKWLGYLEDMLEKNGGVWLASKGAPTIADCLAIPFLRGFSRGFMDYVPADSLEKNPKIVDYIQRFVSLPEIRGRYSDGIH